MNPYELKIENRKLRKVVVERYRRDRIERCLEQLRIILQQSQMNRDDASDANAKPEKAELLEMTVNYICRVQSNLARQMALGFDSCVREVDKFFARSETVNETETVDVTTGNSDVRNDDREVRRLLRDHLISRLSHSYRALKQTASASRSSLVNCAESGRRESRRGDVTSSTACEFTSCSSGHDDVVGSPFPARLFAQDHATRPLREINGRHNLRRKLAQQSAIAEFPTVATASSTIVATTCNGQRRQLTADDGRNNYFRFDAHYMTVNSADVSTTSGVGYDITNFSTSDFSEFSVKPLDLLPEVKREIVEMSPHSVWRPW